eukprot:scaffold19.g1869.t1
MAQPDANYHCIQFWRTGTCQWVGRCRFPHQCYVCGSPAHGTGQHGAADSGAYGGAAAYGGGASAYGGAGGYGGYGGGAYGGLPPAPAGAPVGAPAAGDWQCSCGWGNYPERTTCRKCHASRPATAEAALAAVGVRLEAPDGRQNCIQFWRTGRCQWEGHCRFPHQCTICGSPTHGTGQHASLAVTAATAYAAVPTAADALAQQAAAAAAIAAAAAPPIAAEALAQQAAAAAAVVAAAAPPAAAAAPADVPPLPDAPAADAPAPEGAAPAPAAAAPEGGDAAAAPPAAEAAPAPETDAAPAQVDAAAPVGAGEGGDVARGRSRSRSPAKREAGARSRSRSGERAPEAAPEEGAREPSRYD